MKTNAAEGKRGGKLRKHHWRILGYPVALVLALGLPTLFSIVMGIYGWRVQRELDALEEAIRAKGEPLTRADLDAAYDAGMRSHPGAAAYLEAADLLAQIDEGDETVFPATLSMSSAAGFGAFAQTEMSDACDYMERRASVLGAAARALDENSEVLPVSALTRDFRGRPLYRFRELIKTQGLIALEERDWDTFVNVQWQLVDAGLFAQTMGEPVLSIAVPDLLRAAITTGEVPRHVLEALTPVFDQIDVAEALRSSETTMRVLVREDFEAYYCGDGDFGEFNPQPLTRPWCYRHLRWLPGVKTFTQNDIIRRMRQSTAIIDDTGLPWPERYANVVRRQPFDTEWVPFDEFEAVQQSKSWLQRRIENLAGAFHELDSPGEWWVRRTYTQEGYIQKAPLDFRDPYSLFFHPEKSARGGGVFGYEDYTKNYISFEARLRATRLAMLIELFRQDHGHLPDSLTALDAASVAAIGGDPYNGKPFGYEIVERGFVVYSVGADLVDGGEEYMGDLVVRFAADPPPVPVEPRVEGGGRANRGGLGGFGLRRSGASETKPDERAGESKPETKSKVL